MATRAICSVAGCDKPTHANGLCSAHDNRLRRHGDPLGGRAFRQRQSGPCSQPDCDRQATRKGYCSRHYLRLRKHGDPSICLNPIGERPPTCQVDGCEAAHHAHGFCANHAFRYKKYGHPEGGGPSRTKRGKSLQWLKDHTDYDGDDCLIWPFGQTAYSAVALDGVPVGAHRLMCRLAHGEPPKDKAVAAHSCGKAHEGCVNPRHLRWATFHDNAADAIAHGTWAHGEGVAGAKLTEADVREIRRLEGTMSQWDIARRFGVTQSAVSCIYRRKTWAWLD